LIVNSDFEKDILRLRKASEKIGKLDNKTLYSFFDSLSRLWETDGYYHKEALKRLPRILNYSTEMVRDGLDVVRAMIDKKNIRFDLEKTFGDEDILEDFKYSFDTKVHVRFRPLGVVAHISASNVFLSSVDSLVSSIITRNSTILKVPRIDRFFPQLFLESIREADKSGVITENISLWNFRGGTEYIEDIIKEHCDGIVVWGGEEAIKSYRKDLPVDTRLIEYGPKYSFSIIHRKDKMQEIIDRCSMDCIMWEQAACSSPHVIFVPEDIHESFAEGLLNALMNNSSKYPEPELDIDTQTEIMKFHILGEASAALEGDTFLSKKDKNISVLIKNIKHLETTCQYRNVIVSPYKALEEIYEKADRVGKYIQTVGIWAERTEYFAITERLTRSGAFRFTVPGEMYTGKNGVPHDGEYPLRKLGDFVHIEHINFDKRNEIYEYAKEKTQFYKDRDENQLLTRKECFENSPPFSREMLSSDELSGFIFSSGGTTGRPKYALYSSQDFDIMTRILAQIYRDGGIKKTDRVANVFIAGNLWTSFLVANEALKKIGCLNFPIAGNSDFEVIDGYLERFRINAIVGLPSIIIRMAEICEEKGLDIKIDTILYGGEHFYKGARDYIKKVWSVKRISSAGYAAVDTGPVGYQCDHLTGSLHHLCEDFVDLELIDKHGVFIKDTNIPGEIIVTNINRYMMPIIRFQTGDMGQFVDIDCPCGFKGKTFELLERCDDVIVAGSTNVELSSLDITASEFDGLSAIWQVQVITQNSKDKVIWSIEKRTPDVALTSEEVMNVLFRHAGNIKKTVESGWLDFEVRLVNTGDIDRVERTGKVKKVIDKRKTV